MLRLHLKTRRGRLDWHGVHAVITRFRRYVRPHRTALLLALLAGLGAVATELAAPWPIKIIFDYILSDQHPDAWLASVLGYLAHGPTATLAWVCGAILAIAVFDAVFNYFRDVLLAVTGQHVVGRIRQELFAHLQTLSPADLERRSTADLLVCLTGDVQMLRQMLVGALVASGQSLLSIVALLAVMFWLHPLLTALALAVMPVMAVTGLSVSRQIRRAAKGAREKEGIVAGIAQDVLGALPIVQAFSREPLEQQRFARENRSTVRAGVKTTRLESRLYRVISLGSAAGLCAILFVGVDAVLRQRMTAGDLLVFISYLRALTKPIRNLSKLTGQIAKATSCGQRVAEVFALRPRVRSRPGARVLERVRGNVCFENVSFGYGPGAPPALQDVTLTLAAGERVALVGHTGAGKSTLVKLLLRFQDPEAGTVRIDGEDLRDVTLESLRRQLAWVHQETILFGMSIADNIALGCPDARPEQIQAVGRRVCVDEFVEGLPDGYATILGERGATLSGGQRQRLALARALLREAPILLLDEPATGLDPVTRRLVEQSWLSPDNTATTLVICHRLADLERFDRVVLLDHGRIVGAGPHRELLAAQPLYQALVTQPGVRSLSGPHLAEEKLAC